MKQTWVRLSAFAFSVALLVPASLLAQKEEKDKDVKEKKEVEQIIITRKGNDKEKIVVEINGDKITVNGKPLDEYNDKEGNISVMRSKSRNVYQGLITRTPKGGVFNYNSDDHFNLLNEDSNRALLGVTTEKTDEGVKIKSVTKESAAEKIGLKEGDVITKIDETKIESPDDLSEAIQKHKPADKVAVTYLRDKKEQKVTAELTKWKGANAWKITPGVGFKMNLGDMNFDKVIPKIKVVPGVKTPNYGQNWTLTGGGPKLGLSVQDSDDGKGVKVIEVDEESTAAKAGVKQNDVITEVDGKAINSTDDMVKIIKESKDKASIMVKLQRGGKTQNIEVKMPRKIKTADL